MKITILGSGSAYGCPMAFNNWRLANPDNPKNHRTRASVFLEIENKKFLIDAGPDFRQQINKNYISDLDAVFLTHPHYDHIAALPELARACATLNHSIEIWINEETEQELRKSYGFLFNGEETESKNLQWRHLPNIGSFCAMGINFQTFQVPHHRWHCSAFRYKDFAYITDWESIPVNGQKILQDIKLLLIECNNGLYPEKNGHSDLENVKKVAATVKAERVVLTHLSARVDYDETAIALPDNFYLAYDGLILEI